MNQQRQWYILTAKTANVRRLVRLLKQSGADTFFPQKIVTRTEETGSRFALTPLFPGWIFVACTEAELHIFRKLPAATGIIYWKSGPAIVAEHDITTIQNALAEYRDLQLLKTSVGMTADIEMADGTTCLLPLPSLGYALSGEKKKRNPGNQLQFFPGNKTLGTTERLLRKPGIPAFLRRLPVLFARRLPGLSSLEGT